MSDLDQFSDTEILAMTAVGESDKLGHEGMLGTICTVANRAKANLHWMGGNSLRAVCLARNQYDVFWPEQNNADRQRVIHIATQNPLFGPYVDALGIASDALAGTLVDAVNGAVSYYDSDQCKTPAWAVGKKPCFSLGFRFYFDLAAVL